MECNCRGYSPDAGEDKQTAQACDVDSGCRQTRSRGQVKSGRSRSAACKIGVEAQE